eukprot:TRINITY_DN6958_c0_g1_i1.p1 TRINITY_DN6958_c0_g1~~TRINITY_DN6958_c0_g1_i1.p1  ORF type:complete len:274 (-),score=60.99 TRINITY_DN6958_c0_g1_i1:372-1193(-)
MEGQRVLSVRERQLVIEQIRESLRKVDGVMNNVTADANKVAALKEENKRLRMIYFQQDKKMKELADAISRKGMESQRLLQTLQRTERKFDMRRQEMDDADDRLHQVSILQHKLTVAQDEIGAKEILLKMLGDGIGEAIRELGTQNTGIVIAEQKMASMGIREGDSRRPEVQLLDERIYRMEQKLLLADSCIASLHSSVSASRGPSRMGSQRLSRSSSTRSSGSGGYGRIESPIAAGLPPTPPSRHSSSAQHNYHPSAHPRSRSQSPGTALFRY